MAALLPPLVSLSLLTCAVAQLAALSPWRARPPLLHCAEQFPAELLSSHAAPSLLPPATRCLSQLAGRRVLLLPSAWIKLLPPAMSSSPSTDTFCSATCHGARPAPVSMTGVPKLLPCASRFSLAQLAPCSPRALGSSLNRAMATLDRSFPARQLPCARLCSSSWWGRGLATSCALR